MREQTIWGIFTEFIALALGLLGAFVVAASVFADGSWAERSLLILALIVGYGCLGFLAGWLGASWRTALWLAAPALPAVLIFGEDIALSLSYFALIAGCVALGLWVGARTRTRRQKTEA